jgi:predicted nucleic acid-binding Zn finger protein
LADREPVCESSFCRGSSFSGSLVSRASSGVCALILAVDFFLNLFSLRVGRMADTSEN